jgi:hypothetical protein
MELFPSLRARSWVKKREDYKWILSAYKKLRFGNSSKQQTSTWKIRLLAPFACALLDDLAAPEVGLRLTPRLAWRSYPFLPPFQLPPPPGGPRPPWTRCWAELGLCEPSLLRQRRWGGGGLAGGCRVAAGSCGTILCAPAEGFQLAAAEQSFSSTKRSRILTGIGAFRAENNSGM